MNKINILEKTIANQIAAGEVAERPTLILKELIENAIDAGAISIRIFLKNSGFDQMRIIDDGCGIEKDEITTAFLRHATSKITAIEDLEKLYTMGFRGEALASIAAVSKVTITTKPANNEVGYKGEIEGGDVLDLSTAPCNDGTEIIIRDLFYNTPARKKFLATPTRELRDISDMLGKMIISHPAIRFEFKNNNKKIFTSTGNKKMKDAIMCVYGRDIAQRLMEVNTEEFYGYISHPGFHKPTRSYYHFFINQRTIQSDALNRSLEKAYHTLLPERRFPIAFINIKLNPKDYDINVHPNKLDIKFHKDCTVEDDLTKIIKETLLESDRSFDQTTPMFLGKIASPPSNFDEEITTSKEEEEEFDTSNELSSLIPNSNHQVMPDKLRAMKENMEQSFSSLSLNALDELMDLDAKERQSALEKERTRNKDKAILKESFKNKNNTDILDSLLENSFLKETKDLNLNPHFEDFTEKQKLDLESGFYSSFMVLGQLAASFIVATKEDGLYLIDQHAAHERLLYNKIKESLEKEKVTCQPLLIPMELNVNYKQYSWLIEHIILLQKLGFVLEEFGDNSFIVREVPFWAQDINIISFLEELSDEGQKEKGKPTLESIMDSKMMMRACKSAIKANRYLDKSDINYLFTQLDLAKDALTCPHGRPITIKYSVEEIRRKFLRS